MESNRRNTIGFDQSHNNKLIIEEPAFSDFLEYLFNSNFKIGKIEAGLNYEKLSVYEIFFIGLPEDSYLEDHEIVDLVKYVEDGGSLFIINDNGGDVKNKNNLSILTKHFGIFFNPDELHDEEQFSLDSSRPIITDFQSHFISNDLTQIIHSKGCTLTVDKSIEQEQEIDFNIHVNAIAFSSESTSWREYYNGEEWIKESNIKLPIIAATHYGLGKVVAIGNLSIFSSLQDSYGIKAADDFKFISNSIAWLLNKAFSEEIKQTLPIMLTIPIDQEIFYWIKEKIKQGKWKNIKEIVNFALRVVKIREENSSPKREESFLGI